MKRGKRGISTVIVTIILVGLVLVAVGIVAVVVKNLISQQTKGIGLGKFTINIEIQKASKSGGDILVDAERKAGDGTVLGATFVVSNGTDKETISQDFSMDQLQTKAFTLTPSRININTVTQVSIAPSFASASGEKTTGDITSTYSFVTGQQQGGQQQGGSCNPVCSGATPICTAGICSPCITDTACSSAFGAGYTCINSVCVPLGCVPDSAAVTCGTNVCGTKVNNCGVNVNCPPGSLDGKCSVAGEMCVGGTCTVITPINTGTVQAVWPPNSNFAFASTDLNTGTDYQNKYVNFPGSAELNCRPIARFVPWTNIPTYGKSIVELNFETAISIDNTYKIWNSQCECQGSCP